MKAFSWRLPAVLTCFIGAGIVSAASANDLYPRLVFAESKFDFGTVSQGSIVEHSFLVSNNGQAPLIIRKIHPECGCVSSVVDTDTLKPGESTQVKTVFNSAGFRGEKTKTIRVYTNDPQQSSAVLTLHGTVKPELEVNPAVLLFGAVRRGTQVSSQVMLSSGGADFEITSAIPRSSFVTAAVQIAPAGKSAGKKIIVSFKADAPIHQFRDVIIIHTNNPKNPLVYVPVFADVQGDFSLSTKAVSFGMVDNSAVGSLFRDVTVTNRSDKPYRVVSVTSDRPEVSAFVSDLDQGKSYIVRIGLRDQARGIVRAQVKILTDHPDEQQRELSIPAYAIIN